MSCSEQKSHWEVNAVNVLEHAKAQADLLLFADSGLELVPATSSFAKYRTECENFANCGQHLAKGNQRFGSTANMSFVTPVGSDLDSRRRPAARMGYHFTTNGECHNGRVSV